MNGFEKRLVSRKGLLCLAAISVTLLLVVTLINTQPIPSKTPEWTYSTNAHIVSAAVNRYGTVLAVAVSEQILLFSRDGVILAQWSVPQPIISISLSVDGSRIIVTDVATIYHFSENGTLIWKYPSLEGKIDHVSASEVRRETIAFSRERELYSIQCDSCSRPVQHSVSLEADVRGVKVSADGFFILASTDPPDNTLYLFERGLKIRWQKQLDDEIRSFDFSDDAAFVAVCTRNQMLAMSRTGDILWNRAGKNLTEVEVSHDRTRIIATDGSDQLIVMNTFSGEEIWNYKAETIERVALTSDGKYVAAFVGSRLCFLDSARQEISWCHGLKTAPGLLAISADASVILTTDSEGRLDVLIPSSQEK